VRSKRVRVLARAFDAAAARLVRRFGQRGRRLPAVARQPADQRAHPQAQIGVPAERLWNGQRLFDLQLLAVVLERLRFVLNRGRIPQEQRRQLVRAQPTL